jgi:hypothetical protein
VGDADLGHAGRAPDSERTVYALTDAGAVEMGEWLSALIGIG